MNKVLCLKLMYQNARSHCPESRKFDLRIQNMQREDPRNPHPFSHIFNSA